MFQSSSKLAKSPGQLADIKYEALHDADSDLDAGFEADLQYLSRNLSQKRIHWKLRCVMDWCCIPIFPSQSRRIKTASYIDRANHSQIAESSVTEKIDLLSDEGAGLQEELWILILKEKLRHAKTATEPFYHELERHATFDSSLEFLTSHYTQNGFTRRMARAHPEIAALVWGSVQLVLQGIMRFTSIFEDTSRMIHELSKALPRFQAYVDVLHTPRLHQALRDVYRVCIDFSFAIVKFLRANKCYTMLKVQWSALGRQFDATKAELSEARAQFEAECSLANVQVQAERHREVISGFSSLSPVVTGESITTVSAAQNPLFSGRDKILSRLHSSLMPSFESRDPSLRSRRSCLIHAIGGMGKTETALEYTYRYRTCYSYIFWLKAQTNVTLSESFIKATRKIGLNQNGTLDNIIQYGLEWFQSTGDTWLLVFDNAEDVSIIRKFWPAGVRGAIILTSQNPDLMNLTTDEINLQPMNPDEGSSLIQRFLRRGGSEQEAAENLSTSLGGLPLALAHFAGYVAKSQCTIEQISRSLDERFKSSQIWNAGEVVSVNSYENTLATVWELAFHRLSSDSQKILNLIAFMDPNAVPEDIFIGPQKQESENAGWQYWDIQRFNEAVRILRERHLVERDVDPTGTCLRIHRALQRDILYRLDTTVELRQQVFNEVVEIVREAFPYQNAVVRGDPSQWSIEEKYLPQVIGLNFAFTQSVPSIQGTLQFATILRDAGYYLEQELSERRRGTTKDSRNYSLSPLQRYNQYLGAAGRDLALKLNEKAMAVRMELVTGIPEKKWTETVIFGFGRTQVDMGCGYAQFNRMDEAAVCYEKALGYYSRYGSQKKLTARLGALSGFRAWVAATKQDTKKARDLASHASSLVAHAVGADNPLTFQTMFCTAMVAFTTGDVGEALKLHKKTFEGRLQARGTTHNDTLSSQYNLAVCYQNSNDLENAENHLTEIIEKGCVNHLWRDEDVTRTKFRLSVVFRAQRRQLKAEELRKDALNMLAAYSPTAYALRTQREYTDKDDMELFDFSVSLWHGRTTGVWSPGTIW